MRLFNFFDFIEGQPYVVVNNEVVVEVSRAFIDMTEYALDELLNKNIIDIFRALRVGPNFNIENIETEIDYFLFTKSLQVRLVNIKVIKETNSQIYVLREKPNSRFEDKNIHLVQLCKTNFVGVAVYSVPDMILVKANEKYLNFLEPPYNQENISIGKEIEEIIVGWKGSTVEKYWQEAISTGNAVQVTEYEHKAYTRGITYWDSIITPIHEEGKVKYLVSNTYEVTDRVVNRKKIQDQKAQLETIMNNISDLLFVLDSKGNYIYTNKFAENYFTKGSLNRYGDARIKTEYLDLNKNIIPEQDLPYYTVLRTKETDNRIFIMRRGEQENYFKIRTAPLLDNTGNIDMIISIATDITEHIKNSEIIEKQKKLLETVIDNLQESIYVCDKDGNFIIKKSSAIQLHPNEHNTLEQLHNTAKRYKLDGTELPIEETATYRVRCGKPTKNDIIYSELNGSAYYSLVNGIPVFDKNGNLLYGIVSTLDITGLIEKEKEIRKQKKELEAIIENMNDAIIVYGKEGRLLLLNSEARKMYPHLDSTTLTGIQKGYQYFDLEGKTFTVKKYASTRAFRGERIKNERVVVKREDKFQTIEVNANPIFDDNKNVVSIVLSHRDITEQIKKQQQLLSAEREKSEALEKIIEVKDDFLSIISHEFRTPLNVINTAIQTLNLVYSDEMTDKIKEYMRIIRQNTNRQLRLVNNLLDITRVNAGRINIHKKNVDIVFLTKAITESVYEFASNKGVRVTFVSELEKKIIGVDDEKYERIILNLLSNAIKFTPEGKSIVVNMRSLKGLICIEVKDTGIGIPPNKIDIIFERFGQVDSSLSRQAEGTGIGLSLVKKFVEILGGSISVRSEVGKGSIFTILLPNETVIEEQNEKSVVDLMNDNRLVQTTNIEFSDIYS